MPLDNAGENSRHRDVIELVDGDSVEMAEEARRDGIATATWRKPRETTHASCDIVTWCQLNVENNVTESDNDINKTEKYYEWNKLSIHYRLLETFHQSGCCT